MHEKLVIYFMGKNVDDLLKSYLCSFSGFAILDGVKTYRSYSLNT
jgi:hypothetical protein